MLPPLPIQRIAAPSYEEFYQVYVHGSKPVVIMGLVNDWPAFKKWDFDYFAQNFGGVTAQAYRMLKNGQCDVNTQRGSVTNPAIIRDCMSSISDGRIEEGWAVASPIDLFPSALKKDYSPPHYCAKGKFLRSVLFIGPAGTVSPLHQDLPENIYVMVKGRKRITIFSPQSPVYPNSRFSNLPNHSQIDAERPDYGRFPKLRDAQPYIVDLAGGETLFIPSLWWHHLRNLEPSIAMNFWWSQGWKLSIAWAAAMYKRLRRI